VSLLHEVDRIEKCDFSGSRGSAANVNSCNRAIRPSANDGTPGGSLLESMMTDQKAGDVGQATRDGRSGTDQASGKGS